MDGTVAERGVVMRVLVIGSGGREHALCWAIAASPLLEKLWCAPGNPGIASVAECVPVGVMDFPELVAFAVAHKVDLVVPGPEAPLVAGITDAMQAEDGKELRLTSGIHPKIEPEVAFRIGRELHGEISLEEAAAACTGVASAMEILDSRYRDFKYFSLPDVIADNSSSFMFVVSGTWQPLSGLALDSLRMSMSVNGELKQSALSREISGHPLKSVVQLCQLLGARGARLPAGSIVLAGAATVAEQLHDGDKVELSVAGLAPVSLTVRMPAP